MASVIDHLSTRVRQLILAYEDLKKENDVLRAQVEERDNTIVELQDAIEKNQRDYENLKAAKMIEVTDGDLNGARDRIAKLIREVNQCITLIGEKD